jgi:hypothetical protein
VAQIYQRAGYVYVQQRKIVEGGSGRVTQSLLDYLELMFDELLGREWHNWIIEIIEMEVKEK